MIRLLALLALGFLAFGLPSGITPALAQSSVSTEVVTDHGTPTASPSTVE